MPVSLLKKLDLDKASFHKKISEISTKNMNVLRKMKMCKNTLNIKATFLGLLPQNFLIFNCRLFQTLQNLPNGLGNSLKSRNKSLNKTKDHYVFLSFHIHINSESILCDCLNVKELLAQNRCNMVECLFTN